MRHPVAVAVVTVVALFSLTGCFKMEADLRVHSDDTVSGTLVVALKKELAAMAESSGEREPMFDTSQVPEGATVTRYDDGTFVGERMTFQGVTLAQVRASAEDTGEAWSLSHEGEDYTFDATMDLVMDTGDTGDSGDSGELGELGKAMFADAQVRVAVTFPGPVTETNGDVEGRTVVWHPKVGEVTTMHAEATERPVPGTGSLVAAGLLGVAGVGLVGFGLAQRRRAAPAGTGEPHVTPGVEYYWGGDPDTPTTT